MQYKISELFSTFVTMVNGANAMGKFDINTVSEDVLVPLLSNIYGYKNLRNLNHAEKQNFPGIDLADDNARIAIQVTSDPSINKIKESLKLFVQNELYKKYDTVLFYILTQKQKSYSLKSINKVLDGKLVFSLSDILDYKDALREVASLDIQKARVVLSILEEHIGSGKRTISYDDHSEITETSFLNLIHFDFPESLYIAELNLDVAESDFNRSKDTKRKKRKPSKRRMVQDALSMHNLKFGTDWEVYENQLVTFHNLNNDSLPINIVIDKGTISELKPDEFYGINDNYERLFKSLLRRSLQQQLYSRNVQWQNEEHLFFFTETGRNKRVVKWKGQKESERVVFEKTYKNNKPEEILHCKHFSFKVEFKQFAAKWFLIVKPEWFFSFDGYKRSFYAKDSIDWLKKKENNRHVFNHLRFIHYFLQHDSDPLLRNNRNDFIIIGDIVTFNNSPLINDVEWKPVRDKAGDTSNLGLFK